jgi:hypothetical protein
MSFESEIAALFEEIREEASHRYALENSGTIQMSLDLTHVEAANQSGNPEMDRETNAFFQREFETFLSHVDALLARFEEYYPLEKTSFELIGNRYGGRDFPTDVGDLEPGVANTVCERLHLADAQWVTPLAEPIEEGSSPAYPYGYWSGDAATAFNNGFLAPFRAASERQIVYTKLLTFGIEAFREAVERTEGDLLSIATECRNAMRAWRGSGGGLGTVLLTVVGISASAAGMISGLPAAAIYALGTTSIGTTILPLVFGGGGSSEPPEPDRWDIGGDTAIAILDSAHAAVDRMLEDLGQQDTDVARVLDAMAGVTSIDLARPDIADGPAGFGTVGASDQGVVLAEVSEIYKAGYVNLPAAAAEYEAAYEELYQHEVPESISVVMPLAREAFMDARVNLAGAMNVISRALRDAGASLVEIADTYTWTDDDTGRRFQVYRETVDLPAPPYDPHRRPLEEIEAGF